MDTSKIISLLGEQSEFLLGHTCKTIDKSLIHIPSPSVIDIYGSARIEISKH